MTRVNIQPKRFLLLVALFFFYTGMAQSNMGINNANPVPSAALMVDTASTGPQGVLIPRMMQARRNAIGSPATGLMVYQTDGATGFYYYNGTAWALLRDATNTYPNVELNVLNNSSQIISALALTSNTNILLLSGANNGNAALTGGNTWNGTTFTVGSGGAGWYEFTLHIKGVTSAGGETNNGIQYFLDLNGAGTSSTFISTYDLNSNAAGIGSRNSSKINGTLYLAVGATVQFRGQAWSSSATAYTSTDGGTSITIVRVK